MALAESMGTAALSGGLGIFGSLVNYGLQKKLAAQQNQYNIDMWKMQADYNSPQAQMERFKEAGLNPNLIYGQGSNGNMSTAPQMVTPQAPELSKEMQELGRAFNIEQIRTLIADRKKAQSEAKIAKINADREEAHFDADKQLGALYDYDTNTGMYVRRPTESFYAIDNLKAADYYLNQHLAENYRYNMLLPYRKAYIQAQRNYLVPQTAMSWYEQRFQPYSFWIGQSAKGLNAIGSIIPKFKFNFGGGKPTSSYYNPRSY